MATLAIQADVSVCIQASRGACGSPRVSHSENVWDCRRKILLSSAFLAFVNTLAMGTAFQRVPLEMTPAFHKCDVICVYSVRSLYAFASFSIQCRPINLNNHWPPLTWEEGEAPAQDRHSWRQRVALCIGDAGWIKVKVKVTDHYREQLFTRETGGRKPTRWGKSPTHALRALRPNGLMR